MTAAMIEQDLQIAAVRRMDKIAQWEYEQMLALSVDGTVSAGRSGASVSRRIKVLVTAIRNFKPMTSRPATP